MRVGHPVGFPPERRLNRLQGVADPVAVEVNAVRLPVDKCAELFHQLLVSCGWEAAREHRVLDSDAIALANVGNASEAAVPASCRCPR